MTRPPSALRQAYLHLLSAQVRPFLKERGFVRDRNSFRRTRGDGPLYDMIGFQADRWNNVRPYGFFADAGVGSTEVDDKTAPLIGPDDPPHYLLYRRWPYLVKGLPGEYRFTPATDMAAFTRDLLDDLVKVLDVLEAVDTTDKLLQWAVSHNKLMQMPRTCRYLIAAGDLDLLRTYVTELRSVFLTDPRWTPFINRNIINATGPYARAFIAQGLLDEP